MSVGTNVLMVVVNPLTKYAHFTALSHTYTAQKVAKLFVEIIAQLHGMPRSITSVHNSMFIWQDFFKL